MAAFHLAAIAAALSMPQEEFQRIDPKLAAERMEECGLEPVTVRFEPDLRSDILSAPGASVATDAQLACADEASGYHEVELSPALQPRFLRIRHARAAAALLVEARAWLGARNMLDRVPRYREGADDAAEVARKMETLCGAEGALGSAYGPNAIDPAWAMRELGTPAGHEAFMCLLYASTVAGLRIGLVGNEAVEP